MQTLTIDYLILNLKGSLTEQKQGLEVYKNEFVNPFTLIKHEYGNKTFSEVYDLIHENEKIGIIQAVPRSNIIANDLIQFQYENHLFYTHTLQTLSQIIYCFSDYFAVTFEGINRVDIAKDECKPTQYFNDLFLNITTGNLKIKGREKNVQAYYLTHNGITDFNGFSIGKRNSSRFLRVYNKTKALQIPTNPKPYINQYFEKYGRDFLVGLIYGDQIYLKSNRKVGKIVSDLISNFKDDEALDNYETIHSQNKMRFNYLKNSKESDRFINDIYDFDDDTKNHHDVSIESININITKLREKISNSENLTTNIVKEDIQLLSKQIELLNLKFDSISQNSDSIYNKLTNFSSSIVKNIDNIKETTRWVAIIVVITLIYLFFR